jgi:hypothetical protein
MTTNDVTAVLSLTRSMAAEREWTQVGDFLSGLPAEYDDGILLLEGEGVGAESLTDWIAAATHGAPISTGPLEALTANPAAALAANRVVMVFRCGRLLTAEGVDAATEVLSRPPESYAIVFVGAEAIRDLSELNLIERGIWQALVGEPGVRWAGQDLAELRCLLWSEAEAAEVVAGRIARDRALLEEWLRAPVASSHELAVLRADHALQLAEQEIAAGSSDGNAEEPAVRGARLRAARVSLEALHRRLLRRLDDDTASLERQVTSSLELLQQNLLRNVKAQLEREGNRLRLDDEMRQEVHAVIRHGLEGWRADTEADLLRRARQTGDETSDLFDGVDWGLVNDVSPARGVGSYPGVILEHVRTLGMVDIPVDEPTAGPSLLAPSAAGTWAPVLRIAACGAAFAAVAAVLTAPAIVPVVAAGALGAVGGGLVNRYLGTASTRRAAMDYAQAAVSRAIGGALATVRGQLREATMPARRAVAADFRDIENALHKAALQELASTATMAEPRPAAANRPAEDYSDRARLAALRQQLAQARTGSAEAATNGRD